MLHPDKFIQLLFILHISSFYYFYCCKLNNRYWDHYVTHYIYTIHLYYSISCYNIMLFLDLENREPSSVLLNYASHKLRPLEARLWCTYLLVSPIHSILSKANISDIIDDEAFTGKSEMTGIRRQVKLLVHTFKTTEYLNTFTYERN